MADGPERLAIIKAIPIGKGLDAFRASFESVCNVASIPSNLDALERLSRKGTKATCHSPTGLLPI